ncbi:cell wall hydrolase [Paenibacillus woosongensis]|uniref:Cell wall hydrolase n=2 Tax=Paenibacillus woosongensis TaxID=307580 RepID=A0A7X3CMT9_9BACL|nr:cell wall hydrolase [Paenibacillus woosongensis]
MYIFRQNRYVALLISAILVCSGSISLLWGRMDNSENRARPIELSSNSISVIVKQQDRNLSAATIDASLSQERRIYRPIVPLISMLPMKKQGETKASQPYQLLFTRNWTAAEQALVQEKTAKAEASAQAAEAIDMSHPPNQIYFTRTELLSQADKDQATRHYVLTDEELHLLHKIVMAEAEGEPYEGKVAVANVVLNRLRSANYPDTIKEVIYQKSQFSPVQNGRMDRVTPNEDSIRAVTEALHGRKEVSDDTYYFLALSLATDLTVAHTKSKSKEIGNHTFYK